MIDLLQLRNVISCTWFIKSIKAIKKKKVWTKINLFCNL